MQFVKKNYEMKNEIYMFQLVVVIKFPDLIKAGKNMFSHRGVIKWNMQDKFVMSDIRQHPQDNVG